MVSGASVELFWSSYSMDLLNQCVSCRFVLFGVFWLKLASTKDSNDERWRRSNKKP